MSNNTFQNKEFKDNLQRYEATHNTGKPVYLGPDELTDIAEYYHLHGQLNKALAAIDQAIQMFPGATQPLAFRARVAILLENNTHTAMQYARQIEDKADLDYFYIMAEIMVASGNDEQADRYLKEKSTEISDDDIDDFYLDVAVLFTDYDNMPLAQAWLSRVTNTLSDDYLELKGRIAMGQGNFVESEYIFNKLIDRDPYHVPYWNLLASAQYLHNNISSSIESSDFSLAISPDDVDAILNKANALCMTGNYTEARQYYELFMKLQPHSEMGEMGIASTLMGENKLEESFKHWKKAEERCNPRSVNMIDILRNQSLVCAASGYTSEAFHCIKKLEAVAGTEFPDIHIIKGYIHLLNKQDDKAAVCFSKAFETGGDDDYIRILFFIAYCYYDCGFMQKAHNMLRAVSLSSQAQQYADVWLYLSVTDYELGLQADFIHDMTKAIEQNPREVKSEFREYFPENIADNELIDYVNTHPISNIDNPLTR